MRAAESCFPLKSNLEIPSAMNSSDGTKTEKAFETAVEAALDEVAMLTARRGELDAELRKVERRILENEDLVQRMAERLSEERRLGTFQRLRLIRKPGSVRLRAATEYYKKTVDLLNAARGEERDIRGLHDQLSNLGFETSQKKIGTVLSRLASEGKVVRVRRGVYRVPEYGFTIEGEDPRFPGFK